jgi:hypothetical protein
LGRHWNIIGTSACWTVPPLANKALSGQNISTQFGNKSGDEVRSAVRGRSLRDGKTGETRAVLKQRPFSTFDPDPAFTSG